jgi:diguanylate cyclase (GGDEF)-like protein/putative nucleotidyltransferase with HDIG domain
VIHGQNPDRIVREAAARICASLDVEETMRAIADSAMRALGADRATCYVNEIESQVVSGVYTTETDPRRRAFVEASVGKGQRELPIWRAQLARPDPIMVVEDVSTSEAIPAGLRKGLGSGAFLGVLLEHGSVQDSPGRTILGTLFVTYRTPRRISSEERSIAGGLANLATLALANARLHAQTLRSLHAAEHQAGTDELTGLPNRRVVEEQLEALTARAARRHEPLSVLVLDLDDFKDINDRHGHGIGDDCLRAVGRSVTASLRPGDRAGRVGGEEFLVLLPSTGAKGAWLVAERLRARIGEIPTAVGVELSASFGVASYPVHATSAGALVRAADTAMYSAKAIGRNRSVLFNPAQARVRTENTRRAQASNEGYLSSVLALAAAMDARDPSTHAHSTTVALYAAEIATRLGLSGDRVEEIRIAGLLHDIGKVGVSDAVLHKPGRLTDPESAEMRRHPEIGAKLLVHPGVADVREWVLQHHERPDGRGYPYGLVRDQIRLEALILGVADAYEAMTADRPYRRSLSPEVARRELEDGRGTQFDERVLEAFLAYLDRPAGSRDPAPLAQLARRAAITLP